MQEVARSLDVARGVGVVCSIGDAEPFPAIRFFVHNAVQRDPSKPANFIQAALWFLFPFLKDYGTNYLGVALMKFAFMAATYAASGKLVRHVKRGEAPWRGGVIYRGVECWIFVAFSGGTESQDCAIADAGMDILRDAC